MPETFSLEEAYGGGSSTPSLRGSQWQVSSAAQAQRDAEGQRLTAGGANDQSVETMPASYAAADRAALLGEIARTKDPKNKAILEEQLNGKPEGAPQTFSLEEAYGVKPAAKGIDGLKHQTDSQMMWGGVKAAGGAILEDLKNPSAIIAATDLFLSVPSMLVGVGADTATRMGALIRGVPHKEASELAAQARQDAGENALISGNPIAKALAAFNLPLSANGVTTLMEEFDKAQGKGADYLDKKTKGLFNAEDFKSVVGTLMAAAGAKGGAEAFKVRDPNLPTKVPGDPGIMSREVDKNFFRGPPKVSPVERVDPSVDSPPPPTEPDVVPPPPDSPHARAKEDVARLLENLDPAAVKATSKTLRKQARKVFGNDKQYTEYLSKHADEEAASIARRPNESETIQAVQDVPKAEGTSQGEEAKALGQEEKGNVRRNDGRVDQDLLRIMALGGAGAALAYAYPDEAGDAAKAAFAAGLVAHGDMSKLGDNASFKAVKEVMGNSTLKTIERLPENRSEVTVQSVRETLRRDDVSKSEREIMTSILDAHEGESITAKKLVQDFQKATGNFTLKEKSSTTYADYGLERINRPEGDEHGREYGDEGNEHPLDARTTIWQLPAEMRGEANNHFGDPLYFAHTRHFYEAGIKHVVEIQSDLAQHTKALSSEREADTRTAIAEAETQIRELEQQQKAMRPMQLISDELAAADRKSNHEAVQTLWEEKVARANLEARMSGLAMTVRELEAKLTSGSQGQALLPMLKNWDRRMVREELAASARRRRMYAENDIYQGGEEIKDVARYAKQSRDPLSAAGQARIDRGQAALNDSARVRFATADTVAKVEGWPVENAYKDALHDVTSAKAHLRQVEMHLQSYKDLIAGSEIDRGEVGISAMRDARATAIADRQRRVDAARASLQELERRLALADPNTKDTFKPEHQGIYDRYKKDTEKFLRGLGGQPYTDPHGHTWIEVPTKPGAAGRRAEMFGGAKLEMLSGIAAAGLGMAFGSYLDKNNPLEGAVYGLLGGAAVGTGLLWRAGKEIKALGKASKGERITDLTERHELRYARAARIAWQASNELIKMLPKKADRVAALEAVKKNTVATLKGDQLKAATWYQNYKVRLDASVSDPKTLAAAQDKFDIMSKHTTDMSEAVGLYGNAVGRAVANQALMEELRTAAVINGATAGSRLVQSSKKAPTDYKSVDSPQFANVRVHPDIARSLRFLFENQEPGDLMAGVSMVNTAIKRTAISFSLFHVKSLFDAGLGAFSNPIIASKVIIQSVKFRAFGKERSPFGVNRFLKQMREGGVGDMVDDAQRDGLIYSFERDPAASEDVGGNFYKGMQSVQGMLDKALPWTKGNKGAIASSIAGGVAGYALNPDNPVSGAITGAAMGGGGGTIRGLQRINHAFDNLMWGRVHAAFKLEIYAVKREALIKNTARSANPHTSESAGKIAASYANYIFGGLNWERMAEGIHSKFGRDIALGAFSPGGRRWLQLATFAPDWTISTTMALAKSFSLGKGGGVRGLFSAKTAADLHRQQLTRSALYYFTVANAVNYAYSGHYLWDNKDWTRVELGDGRTMQLSKHFTEPFHWGINPGQQAMNKLGFIPREAATQALNVEYLSAKGRMPAMKESRLGHLTKTLNPIGIQQFRDGGVSAGVSGALGVPIYGRTEAQKRDDKMKAALDKYKKTMGIQ